MRPFHLRLLLAFSFAGILLSVYLTYAHQQFLATPGWESLCDLSEQVSCEAALRSPYSRIGSLPVSVLGLVYYVVFSGLTALALRERRGTSPRSVPLVLVVLAGASCVVSVVLGSLSAISLGILCPACGALYLVNGALLAISWLTLRETGEGFSAALKQEVAALQRRPAPAIWLGVASIALLFVASRMTAPGRTSVICEGVARSSSGESAKPVEVVMFSDFQCPHCRRTDLRLRELRGSPAARLQHRQYPLDPACNPNVKGRGHPGACLQARAAICAQMLGKYEAMSDLLFERRPVQLDAIVELARTAGLQESPFRECLTSESSLRKLEEDLQAAARDGVRATPAFVVEGRMQSGFRDEDFECLRKLSSR